MIPKKSVPALVRDEYRFSENGMLRSERQAAGDPAGENSVGSLPLGAA